MRCSLDIWRFGGKFGGRLDTDSTVRNGRACRMMLWGQLTGFSSWLANPWLLVAGSAAVALPVLIHLLNRRRFQVVEWAAMDFLLEADRTNRRRIRLQHVLLLILRC